MLTKGKLSEYNKYVELRYEGVKVRVPVSVTDGVVEPPMEDSSSEDSSSSASSEQEEDGFDFTIVWVVGGVILLGAAVYVGLMVIKRKTAKNGEKTAILGNAEGECKAEEVAAEDTVCEEDIAQRTDDSQSDEKEKQLVQSETIVEEKGEENNGGNVDEKQ